MSKSISDFRRRSLEANAMLRLPTGAEYWGFAGPHQQHDPAPLELMAAWRWLGGVARSVGAWIAGLCRRGARRWGQGAMTRVALPRNEAAAG